MDTLYLAVNGVARYYHFKTDPRLKNTLEIQWWYYPGEPIHWGYRPLPFRQGY